MKHIYGYIRVSSKDQNEDRQLYTMKELSIPDKNLWSIFNEISVFDETSVLSDDFE